MFLIIKINNKMKKQNETWMKVRAIKEGKPLNHYLEWSPFDEENLRIHAESGLTAGEVAKKLLRTESAIRDKASQLGVKFS